MLRFAIVVPLVLGLCVAAQAQDAPRVEVFGGYSYANIDTNNLTSRQSANGWEASVSGNINRWLAAEGDTSGYYKTQPFAIDATGFGLGFLTGNLKVRDFAFMGGPRVNFRPVFVHALVGLDHLTARARGASDTFGAFDEEASQNSFAAAFGGGIQQRIASHWAVRASADYVLTRHNIIKIVDPFAPAFTQNNFRASVGIVFIFGRKHDAAHGPGRSPRQESTNLDNAPATSEAALLGIFGIPVENGFSVSSVRDGSPAAKAGILPGDVITEVDAKPVRSAAEIESAIAASKTGTVEITDITNGAWLTLKEVKVR